jgi:hypothetical protein
MATCNDRVRADKAVSVDQRRLDPDAKLRGRFVIGAVVDTILRPRGQQAVEQRLKDALAALPLLLKPALTDFAAIPA